MVIRSPMQVDDDFRKRIKKIQENIMRKEGKFKGIPKITREIIRLPEWEIIERKLLSDAMSTDIKINFDRRIK